MRICAVDGFVVEGKVILENGTQRLEVKTEEEGGEEETGCGDVVL